CWPGFLFIILGADSAADRSAGILAVGQPGVSPGEGFLCRQDARWPHSQDGYAPSCYTGRLMRHKHSDYMHWSKTQSRARFNLASRVRADSRCCTLSASEREALSAP